MIDHSFIESERKKDSQVVEMARITVIDAIGICAAETQDRPVPCTVLLATRSVTRNFLDKGVVVGHIQIAEMRVDVHRPMIKAFSDPLL